jgi:hypothetical protein
MKIRNTFIIFLVSGFWHGANWTFVFWGALNAIYFLPLLIFNKNRDNLEIVGADRLLPKFTDLIHILLTFLMTVFAWIFFRAENLSHAFSYINGLLSSSLLSVPTVFPPLTLIVIIFFVVIEWLGKQNEYAIATMFTANSRVLRWSFYLCLLMSIFLFSGKQQQFIYFQF